MLRNRCSCFMSDVSHFTQWFVLLLNTMLSGICLKGMCIYHDTYVCLPDVSFYSAVCFVSLSVIVIGSWP